LASRPEGKPYPGYWEFPGGKVETGESLRHALSRELQEELGIQTIVSYPWITRIFSYEHATVRLHFFRVTEWYGELRPRENQALSWQFANEVNVTPVLPANAPILRALLLPSVYAITHVEDIGVDTSIVKLTHALEQGLRLIQIREKNMASDELHVLSQDIVTLAHSYHAQVLINGDMALSKEVGADGVHLTSFQLMALSERPETNWCGASCHNAEELFHAEQLGVDFVVLGSVLPTLTHPSIPSLGWRKFAALIKDYSLPVYALGGMCPEDLSTAHEHGAHGIAMMRGIT
ncbi:MAG: Nudix family hydrolase, partial [Nitrosomonas sp.]|nr:Nudix family hydrolase [Nitrosomonas sp.]